MGASDYAIIVIAVFFGLVVYFAYSDERRKGDRRSECLPSSCDRRKSDRRQKSIKSYIGWIARSQWSKLTR